MNMAFEGTGIREVKPGSFIYAVERALPADVCREAIRRFEERAGQQYEGRIGTAADSAPSVKRSTDLRISGREDWRDIDQALARQLAGVVGAVGAERPVLAHHAVKDRRDNQQRTLPGEF
jgi:hypothetical protein